MLLNTFVATNSTPIDKMPMIDYKWSAVLPGTRKLLDYGKSHSNAQLFFGRGVSFDGVDQGSVFELPHTLGSETCTGTYSPLIVGDSEAIQTDIDGGITLEVTEVGTTNKLSTRAKCSTGTDDAHLLMFDYEVVEGTAEMHRIYTGSGTILILTELSGSGTFSMIIPNFTYNSMRIYWYEDRLFKINITNSSIKKYIQDELHLYKYNYDTNLTEYEHITSPIPYYDLGKLNGTGAFIANTLSNVITSKVPFSSTELAYLKNYPEKFLYREDSILKSKILTQPEIDNVVAYLPLCETDGYVRDMIGYSEGVNQIDNSLWYRKDGDGTNTLTLVGDGFEFETAGDGSKTDRPMVKIDSYVDGNILAGTVCRISYDIELLSGEENIAVINLGGFYDNSNADHIGHIEYDYHHGSDRTNPYFLFNETLEGKVRITSIAVKKLTSTYPIANYTDACRDDAKQLSTGLQTCFWKRDLLGVPYAGSFDALVSSDIADHTTTNGFNITDGMQIEIVFEQGGQRLSYNRLMEAVDTDASSVFRIERQGVSNKLGFVCNSQNITTGLGGTDICHMIIAFNTASDTLNIYNNGTQITTDKVVDDGINLNTLRLSLMNRNSANRGITGSLRLFKVHTTPMNPLDLYNDAVSKGLLL